MTMITPSYLGETIEYSSLHACRSTLEDPTQCEASLGCALDACERYFPAFQFVVWAGKSAREAMESAMFETSGEA